MANRNMKLVPHKYTQSNTEEKQQIKTLSFEAPRVDHLLNIVFAESGICID